MVTIVRFLFLAIIMAASLKCEAQIWSGKQVHISDFLRLRGKKVTKVDTTFNAPSNEALVTSKAVDDRLDSGSGVLGGNNLDTSGFYSSSPYTGPLSVFRAGNTYRFVKYGGDVVAGSLGLTTLPDGTQGVLLRTKALDSKILDFASLTRNFPSAPYVLAWDIVGDSIGFAPQDTQSIWRVGNILYISRGSFYGQSSVTLPRDSLYTIGDSIGVNGSNLLQFKYPRLATWIAVGGGTTTVSTNGLTASATGTSSAQSITTSNQLSTTRRMRYTNTTAGSGQTAGLASTAVLMRGSGTGTGGFKCTFIAGASVTASGTRGFIGLRATTMSALSANPSTFANLVGVAHDDTDVNWQLMTNDATGNATKIDLGANFPVSLSSSMIRVEIWCAPNASTMSYLVERADNGARVVGTLSTDLPAATTTLIPTLWYGTGTSTGTVSIDISYFDFATQW